MLVRMKSGLLQRKRTHSGRAQGLQSRRLCRIRTHEHDVRCGFSPSGVGVRHDTQRDKLCSIPNAGKDVRQISRPARFDGDQVCARRETLHRHRGFNVEASTSCRWNLGVNSQI